MIYEPPTFCHIYFSLKAQTDAGSLLFSALCCRLFETCSLQLLLFCRPTLCGWRCATELKFWDTMKKCYKVIHLFTTDMFIVSICYQVNWSLNVNSGFDIVFKKKIGAPQKSLKEVVNINQDPIRQRLCLQLFDFTVFCHTCLKIQFSAVNSQSIYNTT